MSYSPFPATSLVICQWADFLARFLKFSFIKNYLYIIGRLHKEFGLDNPLTDNWVINSLLIGILRDSKKAQADTLLRHFWGICILRD